MSRTSTRSTGFAVRIAGLVLAAGAVTLLAAPIASAATPPVTVSHVAAADAHPHISPLTEKDAATGQIRVGENEWDSMTNLTPYTMTLSNAYQQPGSFGPGWFKGEYPSQQHVSPGYGTTWGITLWGMDPVTNSWTVSYRFTDDNGNVMTATAANQNDSANSTCTVTGADAADYTCDIDGGQFTVRPTAADMTISQSDRDAFANALTNVCSNSADSCRFTPTAAPTYAQSAPYIPQQEHAIDGCSAGASGTTSWSSTRSEETSLSDTVGEAASVGFEDIANFSVNHSISKTHTWGESSTNSGSMPATAPAGKIAFISESTGIESVTGDFVAAIGNTTIHLNDVTIDQPGVANPDGTIQAYTDAVSYRPMTQADWATCAGPQIGH